MKPITNGSRPTMGPGSGTTNQGPARPTPPHPWVRKSGAGELAWGSDGGTDTTDQPGTTGVEDQGQGPWATPQGPRATTNSTEVPQKEWVQVAQRESCQG